MARKAVQGYTEKSYYDNTRFSGILATGDPLNEGYFRHLVNFDISDTGQSVTVRKGFLSTTLCHNTALREHISLSRNTVVFRNNDLQSHIVFDFNSGFGYAVDISSYDVENKLVVIDHKIANYDWTDVVTFLSREIPSVAAYALTVNAGQLLTYIKQRFSLYTSTVPIVDNNLIHKVLLKLAFVDAVEGVDYPFTLEIYYRMNAVGELPADTLLFSVSDTTQHPSYIQTERNIASARSIIPDPLQHVDEEEVVGHISTLGLIYVQNPLSTDYLLGHVYKDHVYTFRPHFDLAQAAAILSTAGSKWAYRFQVTSLKNFRSTADELRVDTIYYGPWCNYDTGDSLVFPRSTADDFTNENLLLRHSKETKYIISLVPKTVNALLPTTTLEFMVPPNTTPAAPTDYTTFNALYTGWMVELTKINSKKTLRDAIKALSATALFYVFDLEHNVRLDADVYGDFELTPTGSQALLYTGVGTYASHFLTSDDLLEMLEDLTLNFTSGITFRTFPFVSLDTYQFESDPPLTRWWFTDLAYWGTWTYPAGATMLTRKYNLFQKSEVVFRQAGGDREVQMSTDDLLITSTELPGMKAEGFFVNGYQIDFYMRPYTPDEIADKDVNEIETLKTSWAVSAYHQTCPLVYGYDDLNVTTLPLVLTDDPTKIQFATNQISFQGNRLVCWSGNTLYISEPGTYYYFKEAKKKTFGERIVKVLEYKKILLVFTVQHLYAVYETEVVLTTTSATGTPVQTSSIEFASQCVLYNILTSTKYADAIQIFNQAVLFYSEDGQLFMIKPNTTIDDETRFTLQYFNKSVNDILLNYDTYINERLANYNITTTITKDQVNVKVLLSINYIKIFYYVPGVITYILIYDVINNRYYVYDTLTFTEISDKMFIDSGELYTTVQDDKTYLSFSYAEPNATERTVDMAYANNFKKIAISTLIDAGNLNLNNHLFKRFRDLHVVFKNLDAGAVLFNVETMIDDVVSHPFYETQVQVQEVNGVSYFVPVPRFDENTVIELVDINRVSDVASSAFLYALDQGLFEQGNLLMDFSDFTSNKLLTHRASILGYGKVFRLKLQFVSKGTYKIQNFGIIYKERRV